MAKSKPATRSAVMSLAKLEKLIDGELPADYRSFMSTFDGKLPEHRSFRVRRDYWNAINALRPLNGRSGTIASGWGLLSGTEDHLLVIGDDGGGNWICLALRGSDRGKVFFVDHEYSQGERGRVSKLADSFDEFIRGLKPPPG